MKKYYLPATWTVSAFHIIESESIEAAREIAEDYEKMEALGLNCLPPPNQEEGNDDYTEDVGNLREATPEEIAIAETPSDREALRVALGALRYALKEMDEQFQFRPALQCVAENHGDMGDRGERFGSQECVCVDPCTQVRAAITTAEKALGVES